MRIIGAYLAIPVAVGSLLLPATVVSQDVQYETVTKVELPGALGTMMRVAARLGGGSTEVIETTYIKGSRMRTDAEGSSTIVDMGDGRLIFLDHGSRTYHAMTFDAAAALAERTVRDVQAARDGGHATGQDDAAGRVSFRFSVDRPGERERVAGYNAERFFITLEAEGEYTPEDGEQMEEAGTLVVLTDLWTSTDVPAFRARSAFDEVSARQYAEAGSSLSEALAAAFAEDPAFQVAFEQSAAEASRMEGMPVKTVTTLVGVAPGQRFDRAQITEPQARGGGARATLGRLGARAAAAAAGQSGPTRDEAAPTQSVIMRVTSEIRNISTRSLDAGLFEIPAGYQERQP
jgi:hypothetical protein